MADMSPAQAAATMRSVEGYAEKVTNRTVGMTNMVWALAAAAIFLTYGTAPRALEQNGLEWMYAILWIPGVIGGIALTWALWHSHAVTLHLPGDGKDGAFQMGLHMLIFFAVAGALFMGLNFTNLDWNTHTIMILANGLFAIAIGIRLRPETRTCAMTSVIAGIVMVAAGLAIGFASLSEGATAMAGAGTVFTAWLGSGLINYIKG